MLVPSITPTFVVSLSCIGWILLPHVNVLSLVSECKVSECARSGRCGRSTRDRVWNSRESEGCWSDSLVMFSVRMSLLVELLGFQLISSFMRCCEVQRASSCNPLVQSAGMRKRGPSVVANE